ncbi:hypothetical protein BJ508DRAFT_334732 [Ascobolus immersus RN42]|uniref:Mid2 domain-containing protein n=1 Tax=Ascobolus immersus RN42 TaxID=1160509 RepID=A0A3N4HJH2_ASCIM|nr:hypothetical protein BJ508DRAFT_334732 [Ascobolus immersus RN42]
MDSPECEYFLEDGTCIGPQEKKGSEPVTFVYTPKGASVAITEVHGGKSSASTTEEASNTTSSSLPSRTTSTTSTATNNPSDLPPSPTGRLVNNSASSGVSRSVVIGASVGSAVGALLLFFLAVLLYTRRKHNKRKQIQPSESATRPALLVQRTPSRGLYSTLEYFGGSRRRKETAELEATGRQELEDTGKPAELEAEKGLDGSTVDGSTVVGSSPQTSRASEESSGGGKAKIP